MAQGSVVWRCRVCGNKSDGNCRHPKAGYSIVYRVGNLQRWEAVGRNKHDAERRLTEVMAELHQGRFHRPKPILFGQFSEQWLRDYAEGAVKPMTLRLYRILVKAHLNPAFGGLPVMGITPQHIQRFLAQCLREKGLSPRTANYLLFLLKKILRHARQWRYLREDPSEGIKPAREEQKEMAFLHPDEIRLLLKHADEPYRTLFLTAIFTGMRRGELLGLRWGDIDWHNNLIHIRRSLYCHSEAELVERHEENKEKWRFSTPKSKKSIRAIQMSPRLREALELHRLQCPVSSHDLVFCTAQGSPMDAPNMVKREFLPALSRAGLRRIRFHDLRHTYTTLLIAQGANVKFIQSQLGHSSIEMTLDRYGHLLPDAQRGVGERLDSQVFGADVFPDPRPAGIRANTVLTNRAKTARNTVNYPPNPIDVTAT